MLSILRNFDRSEPINHTIRAKNNQEEELIWKIYNLEMHSYQRLENQRSYHYMTGCFMPLPCLVIQDICLEMSIQKY